VTRARRGDRSAENEIARRQLAQLRPWAHGQLPQAARTFGDTEDAVQETVMRMLARLATIDVSRPGGLQAYLRRSFKNRLIDSLRRSSRRPVRQEPVDAIADPRPSADATLLARESAARFRAAFERLGALDRALITAWLDREWAYEKIARALKKPSTDAARVAVRRACERLSQHLQSDRPVRVPHRRKGAAKNR
jgi:RNA polymerase sigma factor (sigma-70 family)